MKMGWTSLLLAALAALVLPCSGKATGLSFCDQDCVWRNESNGIPLETVAARKKPTGPLDRLGAGTANFFGGIKGLFVAEKAPSKKPSRYQLSGSQTKQRKKEEDGWFTSLFRPEEPAKPKTVNDFLRQERP